MTDLRHLIRIQKAQGRVPACASFAVLQAYEMMLFDRGIKVDLSRLYLYYYARQYQGRALLPMVRLDSVLETLKTRGCCRDELWPYRFDSVDREPGKESVVDSSRFRIESYRKILPDEISACIESKIPVICSLMTGRRFWKHAINSIYLPIGSENPPSTAHAITLVGINDHGWIISNTLGSAWGDNGFTTMSFDCLRDIGEIYVLEPGDTKKIIF